MLSGFAVTKAVRMPQAVLTAAEKQFVRSKEGRWERSEHC